MGVAPDWYGGPGIGIINIGYIELGPYFYIFFANSLLCGKPLARWTFSPVVALPNPAIQSAVNFALAGSEPTRHTEQKAMGSKLDIESSRK